MASPTTSTTVAFSVSPLPIVETVVTTWALMFLMVLILWLSTRRLSIAPGAWQVALEGIVCAIQDAIEAVLPEYSANVLPFIGSLWIFLVIANLTGVIPGLHSPTADLSTTGALAVLVFLSVHWLGVEFVYWMSLSLSTACTAVTSGSDKESRRRLRPGHRRDGSR